MILVIINGFCSGQVHLIHKDSLSRALFSNNHGFKNHPFGRQATSSSGNYHDYGLKHPHYSHSPETDGVSWVGLQLKIRPCLQQDRPQNLLLDRFLDETWHTMGSGGSIIGLEKGIKPCLYNVYI